MELEVQHLHRRLPMARGAIYLTPRGGGEEKSATIGLGEVGRKKIELATYVSLDNLAAPYDLSTGTFLVPRHYCTPKY